MSHDVESRQQTTAFMEAFKEKLDEIRKVIDDDRYRKRVLLICQQTEPRSFDDYSSSGSFRRLEKFESSTYSEVLKAINLADNNKPVVMKIMRALSKGVIRKLPAVATKGCQSYNDILNELVVTQALSSLHDGVNLNGKPNSLFRTIFFCLIHEIKVVNGNLERTLSKSKAASAISDQYAANSRADNNNNEVKDQQGQKVVVDINNNTSNLNNNPENPDNKVEVKDEEMKNLSEDDRMLMESLPFEYVVSVMRHDGQPLWWMMTHKKLTAQQLASVLVQVIVGLAIAEKVYMYEHRDLHVSNILIKKTSKAMLPFVLDGNKFTIDSHGIKATIIDATFSRLTHNGKVYFRDLTSTLRAYGSKKTPTKMSLQNRSYRQMVRLTKNNWEEFTPKTNLIWLTYLCETLMKTDIMKADPKLLNEIRKIRDYAVKANNTTELLGYFPFEKENERVIKHTKQTKTSKTTETPEHHRVVNKDHLKESVKEIAKENVIIKESTDHLKNNPNLASNNEKTREVASKHSTKFSSGSNS